METRTEKWKEYRAKIKEDGTYYLSENQRDLLALDLAKESMVKLPDNADEYIKLLIHKFKVARKIITDIEVNDNES